ncbi:PREDICTED: lymphocyte antigen 6 complex locus protein G5c [Condylura cristata]|uniref:lymphocyte antigen 6 complex locus protein G5c n=1 Tax=Condylura cristata TaxID=143302 RepID=UPI0003345A20|nr:PREDICTED: lymphocyte antigen 6 complex locus protein G5c [Condylura cristata]
MHFMAGPAGSQSLGPLGLHRTPHSLYMVFLMVLIMMSLVSAQQPKYLRCYRCLLETKELGCLLGSDICLAPAGSSCLTLHIKNSSGTDILVSDCRRKEQMSDCSHTRTSPVFGYWIFSQCCFLDFCNNPQNRVLNLP